jgi:hypothetical protein
LEHEFGALAAAIEQANSDERRRIAVTVATAAVEATGLDDAAVAEAIKSLSNETFADQLRDRVEQTVTRLDEEHWDAEDDLASLEANEGVDAFRRARAASSVWFALGGDDISHTQDAVYEAHFALTNPDALRALVDAELGRSE